MWRKGEGRKRGSVGEKKGKIEEGREGGKDKDLTVAKLCCQKVPKLELNKDHSIGPKIPPKRSSLPQRPVQVDDFVVEVVPDDHVKGANGAAEVPGAAVRVLLGLKQGTLILKWFHAFRSKNILPTQDEKWSDYYCILSSIVRI
jgi:hypothetical protein